MNINEYGFATRAASKKRQVFKIGKSLKILDNLIKRPPEKDESIRAVSYEGGFSSISFITYIALKERVEELTASSLRIGTKQLAILEELRKEGKLDKARFVFGTIMKEDEKNKKYDYYNRLIDISRRNGWEYVAVNNHSKIILMKTNKNYYVLETSSNLNDNPKIEQFTFENDRELYEFYYILFDELMKEGKRRASRKTSVQKGSCEKNNG